MTADLSMLILQPLSIFINQLLTFGMPVIDESLNRLMIAMQNPPTNMLYSQMLSWGRAIGAVAAICVGGYEAWMMILARRGMDVMKLLRIYGLACCITFSGFICNSLKAPGFFLQGMTYRMALTMNKRVDKKQIEVAKYQKQYLDSLRSKQAQLEIKRKAEQEATEDGIMDKIKNSIDNLQESMKASLKEASVVVESKLSEWANDLIRFIGEVIFQMMYYGMLIGQRVFMSVMALFCPIAFGLSVAPPFRNAWSQWLSKYVTLSLWGFIVYLIVYYVDYLMFCNLEADITAYKGLLKGSNITSWGTIGAFGLQGIGTTCIYVVSLLAGAKILGMVPEVASWLIPGGISSSAGAAAVGAVGSAVSSTARSSVNVGSSVGSTVVSHSVSGVSGAVSGGYEGAKNGATAGASMPGGAVARTVGATVGLIGGGVVGAVGGGMRGAFRRSDDDRSGGGYRRSDGRNPDGEK